MATLRALDTSEPLERFVELTRQIRALEQERDSLKDIIAEALQHEPASGPNGVRYVDFDGYRVELCQRRRWKYSGAVAQMEKALRALKLKERATGAAQWVGDTMYPKVARHRSRSESEAREKKASAIAAYIQRADLDQQTAWLDSLKKPERDALARRAGQRSPSKETWALVLAKLAKRAA